MNDERKRKKAKKREERLRKRKKVDGETNKVTAEDRKMGRVHLAIVGVISVAAVVFIVWAIG